MKNNPEAGAKLKTNILEDPFLKKVEFITIIGNLIVSFFAVLMILVSYHQYENRAVASTRNLVRALENDLTGMVQSFDSAVLVVREEYQRQIKGGGVRPAELNQYVEKILKRKPGIDAFRITNREGIIRYGSDITGGETINLSDRKHFLKLKSSGKDQLEFSKPQISRANGKWVIVLARPVWDRSGNFDGMIFAPFALEDIYNRFSQFDLEKGSTLLFLGENLDFILKHPADEDPAKIPGLENQTINLKAETARNPFEGIVFSTGESGFSQLEVYRKLGDYPYYLNLKIPSRVYLDEWWVLTATTLLLTLVFTVVSLLFILQIRRMRRREWETINALHEEEEKFRTLAMYTYDWEYWQSPDGTIRYMTPSCERITGYSAEEFEKDPDLLRRIVHGEDLALFEGHFQNKKIDDFCQFDYRILTKSGQIRTIAHHCSDIFDDNNEYKGKRVSNRDATMRKIYEKALQESETRLNHLFEHMKSGVAVLRPVQEGRDFVFMAVNRAAEEIEGFEKEQVIGKQASSIYEPYQDAHVFDRLIRVGESGRSESFSFGIYEQGEMTGWRENFLYRLPEGEVVHIFDDVTEQKLAQDENLRYRDRLEDMVATRTAELREAMELVEGAEYQQRMILEHIPVGILLVQADDSTVLYQNPAFSFLLGEKVKELQSLGELWPLVIPDDQKRSELMKQWNEKLESSLKNGVPMEPFEVELAAGNSEPLFMSVHTSPAGNLLSFTFIDLSERKRAEELSRASLEQQKMLIHQSRLAAMGEMVGNIAHQWRQPLNTLSLMEANLLDLYEFKELNREVLVQHEREVTNILKKMSGTIDSFREFFRPDEKKKEFRIERIISRVTDVIEVPFRNQKIRIQTKIAGSDTVFGYENEFSQVLLSVLNNSRDAIVERAIEEGEIKIQLNHVDDTVVLGIQDNGGGIDPEILGRIFDPFFSTRSNGTGIGLYMSRKILEHMGGTIEAENRDRGVVFIIKLPLKHSFV